MKLNASHHSPVFLLSVLILVGFLGCASASSAQPSASASGSVPLNAFAALWDGEWQGRGSGGLYTTIALDNGVLSGKLRATGTQSFGSDEKTLQDIHVRGRTLSFTAQGFGGPFEVLVELSPDGKELRGTGTYQGYRYAVTLRKKG